MRASGQGVFAAARVAGLSMVYMQALSLLSGVLIARVVGAADYGIFSIARALVLNTHIVVRLGLDVGLQRYLGEQGLGSTERDQRLAHVARLRRVVLALSLAVLLALALGGALWLEHHIYRHPGFAWVLLGAAVALPFMADLSVLGGVYRGLLQITPSVLAEYVMLPTVRLLVIVLLFGVGWRLWAVVAGTTLASAVAAAALAWRARRVLRRLAPLPAQPLAGLLRMPVFRYSLVLSLSTIVVSLARSADLLMLGHFRSAAEAGQYAVAQMAMAVIALFGSAVGQTTGPRVAALHSQGDQAGLAAMMQRQARWIALLSIPLCAVMMVWGQRLLLVFGPGFQIDAAVLAVLAVNQYALAVLTPSGWLLSMTGHHRAELWVMLVGLVLMLCLGFWLIPLLGQMGAAIALLSASLAANVCRVLLSHLRLGILALSWQHVGMTLWPLALAGLLEALRHALRGPASLWDAVAMVLVYGLLYGGLVWRFGLLPAEQQALRARWPARRAGP